MNCSLSLISSFLVNDVSETLILLKSNERCEQITQVAHQKLANEWIAHSLIFEQKRATRSQIKGANSQPCNLLINAIQVHCAGNTDACNATYVPMCSHRRLTVGAGNTGVAHRQHMYWTQTTQTNVCNTQPTHTQARGCILGIFNLLFVQYRIWQYIRNQTGDAEITNWSVSVWSFSHSLRHFFFQYCPCCGLCLFGYTVYVYIYTPY